MLHVIISYAICRYILCYMSLYLRLHITLPHATCHYHMLIIIIYPVTTKVVGAPQIILQPVSSIFPCSPLPSDLANSRPVHSLLLSSHLFLCPPCLLPPVTVPCKMLLARPDELETWPYHCSLSLYNGQEVFMWSDCLLVTDFLVGNMVFVWDV